MRDTTCNCLLILSSNLFLPPSLRMCPTTDKLSAATRWQSVDAGSRRAPMDYLTRRQDIAVVMWYGGTRIWYLLRDVFDTTCGSRRVIDLDIRVLKPEDHPCKSKAFAIHALEVFSRNALYKFTFYIYIISTPHTMPSITTSCVKMSRLLFFLLKHFFTTVLRESAIKPIVYNKIAPAVWPLHKSLINLICSNRF